MADPNQTDAAREDRDETYDPSEVEATRSRMQGDGVGAKDLDRQRDPTRARSADQYSLASDSQLAADRKRDSERKQE